MRSSACLYRRPSGIYVVRVYVPKPLQTRIGRGEIHISTGVRESAAAKVVCLQWLLYWKRRFLELSGMDVLSVFEGIPLFTGSGLIRIELVASSLGIDKKVLLQEIANDDALIWCSPDAWRGKCVNDITDIERDDDGSFIVDSFGTDYDTLATGDLALVHTQYYAQKLIAEGAVDACVFYRDAQRKSAMMFVYPGKRLHLENLMIQKSDAQKIRARFAATISPGMLERAKVTQTLTHPTPQKHKYEDMKMSQLKESFLAAKKPHWKSDQYARMSKECDLFIEVMDDPRLGDIDPPLIRKYLEKLQSLPGDLRLARSRFGTSRIDDLIKNAAAHSLNQMSLDAAIRHIRLLSEALNWGVRNEYLARNPAQNIKHSSRRKSEQKDRDSFNESDLKKIFSARWFREGKGQKAKDGTFRFYQPYYYWLPLLALFSGGRLNELAQLYLADIKKSQDGSYYFDFNLEGADKLAIDPNESGVFGSDKSLKTVHSERVVPIHKILVDLGLPAYADALRGEGQVRLFPELKHDKIKGYGKAAGAWFNDRFLGKHLKMPRDGRKTFHSFRHTFISALFDSDVPESSAAQIAGHMRGDTMSAKRYRKDQEAQRLQAYVDRVFFPLPIIAPFDSRAGIEAVEHALGRKVKIRAHKI